MIRIKLLTFLMMMMSVMAWSQSYVRLVDGSGYISPLADQNFINLTAAADDIISSLPEEFQANFKVYDFGFYLHQKHFDGGLPEVFTDKITEISTNSPYYLLFGRQTDESGANSKLWIDFRFPESDTVCGDPNSNVHIIQEEVLENNFQNPNDIYLTQGQIMTQLSNTLFNLYCCIEQQNLLVSPDQAFRFSNTCSNEAQIEATTLFIINHPEIFIFLEKLYELRDYWQRCSDQKWSSYQSPGIIPGCFWENVEVDPIYYYGLDIPFTAGKIDGIYAEIVGIEEALQLLPELDDVLGDIIHAYTVYYYECEGVSNIPSKVDLFISFGNLKDNSALTTVNRQLSSFAEGAIKKALTTIRNYAQGNTPAERCAKYDAIRTTVDKIIETIDSWDEINALVIQLGDLLTEYLNGLKGEDNIQRYRQGRLSAQIVSVFYDPVNLGIANRLRSAIDNVTSSVASRANYVSRIGRAWADDLLKTLKARQPFAEWSLPQWLDFRSAFALADYRAVKTISDSPELLNTWKVNGADLHRNYAGSNSWPIIQIDDAFKASVRRQYGDEIGDLVDAVDNLNITNNSAVGGGAYHPSLSSPSTNPIIAVNFKSGEIIDGTAQAFIDALHPILKKRVNYLEFLKKNSLLDASEESIVSAGKFGSHAEFRVLDKAIKDLEALENLPVGSFPESRLDEFYIFVKAKNGPEGLSNTNPPRCVCCWHGTHGVKVIGNE